MNANDPQIGDPNKPQAPTTAWQSPPPGPQLIPPSPLGGNSPGQDPFPVGPLSPNPWALPPVKAAEPTDGFVPAGERKEDQPIPPKETVFKETAPIVEVGPPKELSPEVKDWMERLETGEEIQLPQPVTDDMGQIIVDTPAPQHVDIKLPLTEAEIQSGLHREIFESIRWLAEWCKRLLRIIGGKFTYQSDSKAAK